MGHFLGAIEGIYRVSGGTARINNLIGFLQNGGNGLFVYQLLHDIASLGNV